MDCACARRQITERTFNGVPDPRIRLELDRHLVGCPDCARFERDERRLTDALTLLRSPLAIEIDVAERTRQAMARLGPIRRTETDPRALLGIAAIAAFAACLLGFALVLRLPHVVTASRIAGARVEWIADRIGLLTGWIDVIRHAVIEAVFDLAHGIPPILATIESPARLLLGLAYLAMAAVVAFVLSREWRVTAASTTEPCP